MKTRHTWALPTEDPTPLCVPGILYSLRYIFLLDPFASNGDSIVLDSLICNPPGYPSPLPYTLQRQFAAPLRRLSQVPSRPLPRTVLRLILHSSPPNQPYTKYLCIYFLGIPVASVHLMAIRQDRFQGFVVCLSLRPPLLQLECKSPRWIFLFIPFPLAMWVPLPSYLLPFILVLPFILLAA